MQTCDEGQLEILKAIHFGTCIMQLLIANSKEFQMIKNKAFKEQKKVIDPIESTNSVI